jgi:hypothetical protein
MVSRKGAKAHRKISIGSTETPTDCCLFSFAPLRLCVKTDCHTRQMVSRKGAKAQKKNCRSVRQDRRPTAA